MYIIKPAGAFLLAEKQLSWINYFPLTLDCPAIAIPIFVRAFKNYLASRNVSAFDLPRYCY